MEENQSNQNQPEQKQNPSGQSPLGGATPLVSPIEQTPSTPQIPPVSKPKFPFFVIIGIIIFLILAGGAAGFYAFRPQLMSLISKPAPTPTLTPSPTEALAKAGDPTANWKTYTADSFSFKYPDDKFSVEQRDKGYFAIKPTGAISGFEGIFIDARTKNLTYSEVTEKLKSELIDPKVETISLGLKVSGVFGLGKPGEISSEGIEIYIAYLNTKDSYVTVESTDKNSFPFFDQILSTFKFVE